MKYAIQWLRCLVFNAQMYIAMLVVGVLYMPAAIISRNGAIAACHAYCRWIGWTASWMIGLKCEIRGEPPTDEVMVAAKHQSFLDVLMIYGAIPRGKFIMKSILKYAPIIGQFGLRIGCIPVNRGKRGVAVKQMLADVKAGRALPGQLIIYPQGTRIPPGEKRPYKIGTGALYRELGQPVVPVATNVGVFWPKRGVYRKPGTAVFEFLPRIAPGLDVNEFMKRLETDIESASDRLNKEAGFERP
ncbi:lysophospholipid acyltransferase family protein [Yoonia sediminilitoris]|uniref:1-acyl-sn-glycerol-3-phosphate acyltransferase n=1 Tax=Yoonia sediminilitoris TaxID=1286148 RepID=A0A2T6KI93_9RHOB|nr:1-acyl-sn-glycerol-3-phosphate acyltransferase [Yoonia sediminilitoris]PUB15435.1 1-acyl-sn-glycerol-3-phosphate acyltransferase [Yoonia sediminilitoris]RCW96045.1 1-acyl-sn-glycerol-3-phosphate acyltransferase [Yoonia sediminilitoris]